MKILFLLGGLLFAYHPSDWLLKKENGYSIYYQSADESNIDEYNSYLKKGINEVKSFFSSDYQNEFNVYVHPSRKSLDSTWQYDWKMPEFKSECWMIASGVADRLDMISPQKWNTEACEHKYENKTALQQVITHELAHIFHAQLNKSKDFSEIENLDWFVEGLATYASGQLTIEKIMEVKKAIEENKIPSSLNDFWKGRMRYHLSGSVILYMDKTFGRKKLVALLPLTRKSEVLSELNLTEEKFLSDWKVFMLK